MLASGEIWTLGGVQSSPGSFGPVNQAFRVESLAPSLKAVCSSRRKAGHCGNVGRLLAPRQGKLLLGPAWGQLSALRVT